MFISERFITAVPYCLTTWDKNAFCEKFVMCKMDLREVIQGKYSFNTFINLNIKITIPFCGTKVQIQ